MMTKAKLVTIGLLAALLLVGCTHKPKQQVIYYYPTDPGSQNAQAKLAETAVSVSDSLTELAAIEKATHPKAKLSAPPNPDAIGLGALASMDANGPIEPVVESLAKAGDYRFRVVGKRPAIPVLVSVYAKNMPLADILRDVNFQGGRKADVLIYPSRRTIELRYRNA